MFESGTSGIFRFVVKSDIPGFNWPFLIIIDFAIVQFFLFFILTYCINTIDLKSQKTP